LQVVYEENGSSKIQSVPAAPAAPVAINATVGGGESDGEDVDIDAI
jgi:hypothetical protein